MCSIKILANGYSEMVSEDSMKANCTCTVIRDGDLTVIVDTMTPWDKNFILESLKMECLEPDQIDFVVSTHGHSDHLGNNNLFLKAKHIVGDNISTKDLYYFHNFEESNYVISDNIEIMKTPGHTPQCVSVIVKNCVDFGTVVIAGDLFEKEADILNSSLWISAGSFDKQVQRRNRFKVADIADFIVPGHGGIFRMNNEIRESLKEQMEIE